MSQAASPVTLNGSSLTLADLVRVARDPAVRVACDRAALERVARGRARIDAAVDKYRFEYNVWRSAPETAPKPALTYGVTTGFGLFKHIPIAPEDLEETQRRLLLSHAAGVGDTTDVDDPANYFPAEVVRAAILLRINAFLKGCSGVRVELVETVLAMLNGGVVPLVPTRGSLGASGDLCPLSHCFATLLGEGRFYTVADAASVRAAPRGIRPATDLAACLGRTPAKPTYKEGLALINGTNFSTAILALAAHDAAALADTADTGAALALEAVCGRTRALDPRVHELRGHPGQIASAARMRDLLAGSGLVDRAEEVQDVYSLRCAPQVHGASRDALAYATAVVTRELNAATDNPLFFPDGDTDAFSAGNFHGQPIALAADTLAIAVAELASISERRTQMLLDRHHNRHLPANLVARRGVNSGYMIAQYTAAALVSENKVLAHPASVDSIPSSANSEDHVSMSLTAARKLRTILGHAQAVLAIEMLVGAQAVEWRVGMDVDPNAPAPVVNTAKAAAAEVVAFTAATDAIGHARIAAKLGAGTRAAYEAVRRLVPTMVEDRPLDGDIRLIRRAVESGEFNAAIDAARSTARPA